MARRAAKSIVDTPTLHRPMATSEAREQLMISLAYDLVEQRLRDGTASSQETTHFLKLATEKARTEVEILELQKELVKAKTEALQSQKNQEELMERAIRVFQHYQGALRKDDGENVQ